MVESCLQEWNELEKEFVQLQVSRHFGVQCNYVNMYVR